MAIYALEGARPELPPEGQYWIAPDATLIGRVRLLPGASVWFGATLRGDNDWITVGENSNIQDGSVLHTDAGIALTIGAHVTVGHRVVLHGCTIGDASIVGMGAVVMNRARVGANSIVGAGALVPEGKEFPERSLILGMPGRVARALSEEEAKLLPLSAEHYVANWRRYAKGFKAL